MSGTKIEEGDVSLGLHGLEGARGARLRDQRSEVRGRSEARFARREVRGRRSVVSRKALRVGKSEVGGGAGASRGQRSEVGRRRALRVERSEIRGRTEARGARREVGGQMSVVRGLRAEFGGWNLTSDLWIGGRERRRWRVGVVLGRCCLKDYAGCFSHLTADL